MTTPVLASLGADAFETGSWSPGPADEPSAGGYTAPARVLVVDDETVVRSLVARLLEERGHTVYQALNGGQALQIAIGDPIGFDLVIADVRMPVMDGWQLGRHLRERWPALPVLYMSGYDEEQAARQDAAFVRKPFDPDELLERVTQLLRGL